MTDHDKSLAQLHSLLQNYDHAMLTSLASDGTLHSRPMRLQADRLPDADLWFASTMDTTKGREIEANPNVGLAFFHSAKEGYISISGTVKVDRNRDRIRQLWKDEWKAWFPQGPEDPDLALLLLDIRQAEYQSPQQHAEGADKAQEQAATGKDKDAEKVVTVIREKDLGK